MREREEYELDKNEKREKIKKINVNTVKQRIINLPKV